MINFPGHRVDMQVGQGMNTWSIEEYVFEKVNPQNNH